MKNREIKFRAWSENNEAMYEDEHYNLQDSDNETVFICADRFGYCYRCVSNSYGNETIERLPEDCKIMQYTGLKDNNGKEIYEGDIVRWIDENFEVQYSESDASFILTDSKSVYMCYDNSEPYEVIGNVYENPELL